MQMNDDLIDRQAAIDAVFHLSTDCVSWLDAVVDMLDALPSAQPEIIQCKDCMYKGSNPISDGRYWCVIHGAYMYYCSDAERKKMDDSISRQAAIDVLREYKTEPNISDDESEIKGYNDGIDLTISVLSTLPSVQSQRKTGKWIPVTERLPEAEFGESKNVLVTCEWADKAVCGDAKWVDKLYFNGGNWCYPTGETYVNRVTAWMPLPSVYQGE